ncbi:hypothetical protein ACPA2L_30395 [Bacillus bombysepticus]
MYLQYKEYCGKNGLQFVSNVNFSKQISQMFGYKSHVQKIDGKSKWLFIRNE